MNTKLVNNSWNKQDNHFDTCHVITLVQGSMASAPQHFLFFNMTENLPCTFLSTTAHSVMLF